MEEYCRINRWEMLKQQLQNVSPETFLAMKKELKNAVIIDCRNPKEFATGHLKGAVNMDYFGEKFYDELESLDAERTYLVYCRSGRRSLRTCTLMKNSGFKNIFNLDGGLNEWHEVLEMQEIVY